MSKDSPLRLKKDKIMGYLKGEYEAALQTRGQEMIYSTNVHWITLVWPTVLVVTSFALFTVFSFALSPQDYRTILSVFLMISMVVFLSLRMGNRIISDFTLTSKQLQFTLGCWNIYQMKVLLRRVKAINTEQTVLGKILDYGTIILITMDGTITIFRRVAHAMEFRKAFMDKGASYTAKRQATDIEWLSNPSGE